MPAEITVVIPTLNAESELPECLQTLMEGVAAGLIHELVVSDGGSADATVEMAAAVGAKVHTGGPSRGGQLRRGCAAAEANWLLVLHADSRLMAGWTRVVSDHLQQGQGLPACFRLMFRAEGVMPSLVAGWANLRTRVFGLPYGDQGLLMRRSDYLAAGGYPDQPLMEDVAMVLRLQRLRLLPMNISTSAARYQKDGWVRRGSRNLWTLLRYGFGAKPDALARNYRK